MPENGFHVGGGWWFVREPGGHVRLVKEPNHTGPMGERQWLMTPETWRSVVEFVTAQEASE